MKVFEILSSNQQKTSLADEVRQYFNDGDSTDRALETIMHGFDRMGVYCGRGDPNQIITDYMIKHRWNKNDTEDFIDRFVPAEEQEETEDDTSEICSSCDGSGEGQYEGTRCRACNGTGEVKSGDPEEETGPWDDYDDGKGGSWATRDQPEWEDHFDNDREAGLE